MIEPYTMIEPYSTHKGAPFDGTLLKEPSSASPPRRALRLKDAGHVGGRVTPRPEDVFLHVVVGSLGLGFRV